EEASARFTLLYGRPIAGQCAGPSMATIAVSVQEDTMQAKTLSLTSARGTRLLAATLMLALTGAFVSVAHAQTSVAQAPAGPGYRHGGGHGEGRMLERMLDSVNASPDQRSEIQDIMKSAMADQRAQREASRGLREQAMTLFA